MGNELKKYLDAQYEKFNNRDFIINDPISIPKLFSKKEDIEIIGFLIAIISWGQRISIIRSGKRLIELFHQQPLDFVLNHTESDLKKCQKFVHRTFNGDDLISIVSFLQHLYKDDKGLEFAFSQYIKHSDKTVEKGLIGFRKSYEDSEFCLHRTLKHIASPLKGSACKRINMFLRWMVRKDDKGVDFGIWNSIKASQLICPLDVHVLNQAGALGLIKQGKGDWKTALYLTDKLRKFDSKDPVKYDFALFGTGIENK